MVSRSSPSVPVDVVVLNEKDNVATAVRPLPSGKLLRVPTPAGELSLEVIGDIPPGHKVALTTIELGGYVIKFGEIIGRATAQIRQGSHVHVHNVESLRARTEART